MKIIIFAGGTGKRLWPLSREDAPKQFQKLFGNESSLENSFNLIKEKFKVEDIFISTQEKYAHNVFEVIPNLPKENLILEPLTRDTGPAVGYAMLKIAQKFPNEPVVIRWQNSLIKDAKAFVNALNEADSIFENKEAELVYLAVPSRYPNTNLGHIKLGKKIKDLEKAIALHDFDGFVEKPNLEKAIEYHNAGNYAWNPGCYITKPKFILEKLVEKAPEFYAKLKRIQDSFETEDEKDVTLREFETFEKKSIDYVLWEKLDHEGVKVVLAEYKWSYVSTWADLKKALENYEEENVTKGEVKILESKDNLVYNYNKNKLIALIGIEGIEIVDTPDALLIVKKDKAGRVKELVESI